MTLPDKISKWIREKTKEAKRDGVVVGMSGGLDSSVTAVLCKRAFPENTLGLIMPCFSREEDIRHARLVARIFDIKTKEIDLSDVFTQLRNTLERHIEGERTATIATANIKPRLRMITLYYFANRLNYLVVGTGNKSELSIGYFTKYGDGGVDLLPLGDILKTDLKKLARDIGIPEEIINKKPSAGLWEGQTDEDEIGMSYEELDRILRAIESRELRGYDTKLVGKVNEMIAASRHKREKIPVLKV